MKHILLPTDFSDNAWRAASYSIQLYADENCTFYFMHAAKLKVSNASVRSSKLSTVMTENNKAALKELIQKAQESYSNSKHTFKTILSADDLQDAIKDTITALKINLVVMGTKGASKAKGMFFGSNTVSSLTKIKDCPVLIVPENANFKTPEQLAFPTDFNRFYGKELEPIIAWSNQFKTKIKVVHINEKENLNTIQETNLEQLKKVIAGHSHSFDWMRDYDNVSEGIKDFIEVNKIDMLAMINYKHSFLENLMNEPVIKKLGFQTSIPFLIVPCDTEK
ncbi:MAG: universal stress protein [Cellulophaga sp.]|nr:universal stress protein [Cellulophaga sp.]